MKKKLFISILFLMLSARVVFAFVPPSLGVNFSITNDICNESHGSITASGTGGTPPYTYLWSTSATTNTLINIPTGTYTVTVTDFVGNTISSSDIVPNNPNLWMGELLTTIGTNSNPYGAQTNPCPSLCNGKVAFYTNLLYGTPPYTVSSNIGVVGVDSTGNFPCGCPLPNISGLCNGNLINVQITDAQGCFWQSSCTIPDVFNFGVPAPQQPNPVFTISGSCNSMNDGSVTVTNFFDNYWGTSEFITDSLYNHISGPYPYSAAIIILNNLAPGNYFLEHNFVDTYTPCTSYYPFNIPDLGTNCGTLQGDVFVDINSNCAYNSGSDYLIPDVIMQVSPGPVYAYTNQNGHYTLNLPYGTYTTSQQIPATFIQTCATVPTTSILSSSNQGDTISFADSSNIMFDISAGMAHGIARPGFNFEYAIGVTNHSYFPSGMLTVTLNFDTLLSLVSTYPAPFSTSPGQVIWNLSQLTAFQNTIAHATVSVPANPSLIGDTLHASASVQATTAETFLANNNTGTTHIITGSFDPNVKEVEPPGVSFTTNTYLKYTIQFQNTGTDTAFNIEVVDTLSGYLNPLTFTVVTSSHSCTTELSGNGVAHFHFNNINLPDSNVNESLSHGFVSFMIMPDTGIALPAQINNKADIYFDFNPPVTTNSTSTSIFVPASVSVTSNDSTICAGNCVDITAAALSGTPPYTYSWTPNLGTGAGPHTVCPVSTTIYTAVITDANNVTASSSVAVAVNTQPTPSITPSGPTTFCMGNSVTLNSSAASSYLWSDNSATQSINVTTSGNYFVTVSNANGCTASSSAVSVTVNPLPTASISTSGPTTFCQGDSVILTSNAANTYLWSNTAVTQSINVTSSGNYSVTVTDANACTASTSLSVTVNPNPPAPATTQAGDSLTSDAAVTYQWYFNSVLIPGATSQSYHPTQNGNYSVVISDANNCTASSTDYPFIMTGIHSSEKFGAVTIYPNPTTGTFIIQTNSNTTKEIVVTDLLGNTILKSEIQNPKSEIDLSLHPKGIYFIKVIQGDIVSIHKIIRM